ncbi:MAG: hypothetical protein FWD33_04150 [Alphaproteobacteria bacterium]|nr:hypothetical protein [Alphaproteobacteria bacterium]
MRKVLTFALLATCLFSVGFSAEEQRAARTTPQQARTTPAAATRGTQTSESRATQARTAIPRETAPQPRGRSADATPRGATPEREVATRQAPGATQTRTAIARGQIPGGRQLQPMVGEMPINNALRGRSAVSAAGARSQPGIARSAAQTSARGATAGRAGIARTAIATDQMQAATPYGICRAAYFSCMDEFCAARDAQFRRCACSARVHDLIRFQANIEAAQDRLKDHQENLVLVGATADQAIAALEATAGEAAFTAQRDRTANRAFLDGIAEGVMPGGRATVSEAIILNIDMNAPVADDWLGGHSRARELFGRELFDYTHSSCRRMVANECSDQDLEMARSAYMMLIEQDCAAIERGYGRVADTALQQVAQGGALLDEARLAADFDRNSDSAIACKAKLQEQMRLPAVCGPEYELCIDVTGQFVNRNSGRPILTPNLYLLESSLDGNETNFRRLLNSKRPMVSSALDACQREADAVWNSFLFDAIGNIRVAQRRMVDAVRQDCTKLISACFGQARAGLEAVSNLALGVLELESLRSQRLICQNITDSCQMILAADRPHIQDIILVQERQLIYKRCLQVGKDCLMRDCVGMDGRLWSGCDPSMWHASDLACEILGGFCQLAFDKRSRMVGENRNSAADFTLVNEASCLSEVRACAGETFKCTADRADHDDCKNIDLVIRDIWGDWHGPLFEGQGNAIFSAAIENNLKTAPETVLGWFYTSSKSARAQPVPSPVNTWNSNTCALWGNRASCCYAKDCGDAAIDALRAEAAAAGGIENDTALGVNSLVAREMLKKLFIETFDEITGVDFIPSRTILQHSVVALRNSFTNSMNLKGDISLFTALWGNQSDLNIIGEPGQQNIANTNALPFETDSDSPPLSFTDWLRVWPKNRSCQSGLSNNQLNHMMTYANTLGGDPYASHVCGGGGDCGHPFYTCNPISCTSFICPGGAWGGLFDPNAQTLCPTGQQRVGSDCVPCLPGFFQPTIGLSRNHCRQCLPPNVTTGGLLDGTGSTGCQPCEGNTFFLVNACNACPAAGTEGVERCDASNGLICDAMNGWILNASNDACVAHTCPQGKRRVGVNCESCPAGTYSNTTDSSTECNACAGFVINNGAECNTCNDSPQNRIKLNANNTACVCNTENFWFGTYTGTNQNLGCIRCNTSNNYWNGTNCVACVENSTANPNRLGCTCSLPGRTWSHNTCPCDHGHAGANCTHCPAPAKWWDTGVSPRGCKDCPSGGATCPASPNGVFESSNPCLTGTEINTDRTECVPVTTSCPANSYRTPGIWSGGRCLGDQSHCCTACPANATCNDGTNFTCQAGFYHNAEVCNECEAGWFCSGASNGTHRAQCLDGVWSNAGQSACTSCAGDHGFLCTGTNNRVPCTDPNFFCRNGEAYNTLADRFSLLCADTIEPQSQNCCIAMKSNGNNVCRWCWDDYEWDVSNCYGVDYSF